MRAVSGTLGTVRYWAGQKLLHSRWHPLYLKISGQEPKPQTYEEWLLAEANHRAPAEPVNLDGFEIVSAPGVIVAADAPYFLLKEARRAGATHVYSDEDQVDRQGNRHSPLFKPDWSPELLRSCDYIGGCFLRRKDADIEGAQWVHVPRVLFHRASAPGFSCEPPLVSEPDDVNEPDGALVSVIICSRDPGLLDTCVSSLRAKTQNVEMEIVAVIHLGQGRDDDLRLTAKRHALTAVEYSGSFHFGRMCNQGARSAKGGYLLFLNDDTAPLESDWLARMLAQAARKAVGAVGATLYFTDGRIQHAGVMIGTPNGAGHPGRLSNGSPCWPWLEMTREVSAVTGACLLMRREVFAELGGFDEAFPVNYNDVDLCLRARRAGYKVMLDAQAKVEHAESTTRKIGIRYGERLMFLERWADLLTKGDPYFNPNLTDNELLLPDPAAFSRIEARRAS